MPVLSNALNFACRGFSFYLTKYPQIYFKAHRRRNRWGSVDVFVIVCKELSKYGLPLLEHLCNCIRLFQFAFCVLLRCPISQ